MRQPDAPGAAFARALSKALRKANIAPGDLHVVDAYHDDFCPCVTGGSGLSCICKPVIRVKRLPKAKDN